MINILAIIAVRNEEQYIAQCIEYLIQQDIQIAIIDNDSTDRTLDICRSYSSKDILLIHQHPFSGVFDLQGILEEKETVQKVLQPDWCIHHDADEIMQTDIVGESLRQGIERVARKGYSVINFDEFVFIYESDDVQYEGTDYLTAMQYYYFFQPCPGRLNRIYKYTPGISNIATAGHRVRAADKKVYPFNFCLRHYISLSYDYAVRKFTKRKFSQSGLDRGWHGNRTGITREMLTAPPRHLLQRSTEQQGKLDTSAPCSTHFWQW